MLVYVVCTLQGTITGIPLWNARFGSMIFRTSRLVGYVSVPWRVSVPMRQGWPGGVFPPRWFRIYHDCRHLWWWNWEDCISEVRSTLCRVILVGQPLVKFRKKRADKRKEYGSSVCSTYFSISLLLRSWWQHYSGINSWVLFLDCYALSIPRISGIDKIRQVMQSCPVAALDFWWFWRFDSKLTILKWKVSSSKKHKLLLTAIEWER